MTSFMKPEETNWNRACRLLTEAGKEVLMLYLHDVWSRLRAGYVSLDDFLAQNRSTLNKVAAKGFLEQTQMDILYPASGFTDTGEWDITLVSCVINNCIPNKTVLQRAAIKTIRELRNRQYGHDGKMKMNDKEFTQNWAEIQHGLTVAARDLCVGQHFSLQAKKDRIEKEQIVDCEELRNTIQAWKSCDIVLSEGIQLLGEENKELMSMMTKERRDTTGMKNLLDERTSHDRDMERMMTEERRDTTEMKTLLEERTSRDRHTERMMTEERRDTEGIKTLLEKRTRRDKDMKTMVTAGRRDTTEMKTLLEERTSRDRHTERMMTEERRDTEGIKTLLEERTRHDKDMKTMMTEERRDTEGIKTLLEERTRHVRDLKTMMVEERRDTEGMKTLLEERTRHDIDMKTMVTAERRDTTEMKTLLEERTSHDRDIKNMMTEERRDTTEIAHDMKTVLSEVRGIKTMMTLDNPRPVNKFEDSGRDPPSFRQRVTDHPSRQVIQQECTVSDSGLEAEAALPEEFRVLHSGLMEYYKYLLTMPTGVGNLSDQVDLDEIYAEPCLVHVDHTAGTKEKAKEKEKTISLNDIFLGNTNECRQIYVSGDAGKGKSSLCKRIIKDWCSVHSQGQLTDDPGQISTLKQFHFLFYLSLKNACEEYDINEMIVSQLLYRNHHIKQAKYSNDNAGVYLDNVLELYSERCLVILDGLDEWVARRKSRYPSVSNGIPGRNPLLKYTILTTTRPWKLESLRLKSTEIDCQIDIRGVDSIDDFGQKLVFAHNKMENKQKQYVDFEKELYRTGLQEMEDTPILLKQLICLWHNDQPFGKSKTGVYTHMLELLFKLAEKREDVTEFDLQKTPSKVEAEESPIWFKNMERCERYKCLILSVGKLAFETMFCSEKETQLVFESSEARKNGLNKSDVDVCLNVGILTQSIIPDKTWEKKSLSFLHKTFHEYFAALYLSVFGKGVSDIQTRIGRKCKSLVNVFNMEDMFLFLSGMCPSLMEDVSACLVTAINNDTEVEEARLRLKHGRLFQKPLCSVQSLILACCKESSDNDMGSLYLPVPDVVMSSTGLGQESCRTLGLCIQKYPSELRSFEWKVDNFKPAMKTLMDLSNLSHLICNMSGVSSPLNLSRKVIEHQLVSLKLHDVSSQFVLSTIRQATHLKTLTLRSVQCSKSAADAKDTFSLDLAGHNDLANVCIEDIPAGRVTLNSSIRIIIMKQIHTLSHDGMCSLMSSISNAHSLTHITLDSVKCRDHATREGCHYVIDLSGHSGLRTLDVRDISLESVTLSPAIREITMRNIHTMSHGGMCSLMSGISNTHSLEDIALDSVKCGDHITAGGCQYEIDLSAHSGLRTLDVRDISLESVTLSPAIREITMRYIHTLSHGGMCSLMSSISNTHSLEHIDLISVKCGDHITGEGCQYEIDLSGHSGLKKLAVRDISLESVTPSPAIREITMGNIHTLSHGDMCSLMSSISNAHSLEVISLESVKCRDHVTGEGRQYEIDLSGHSGLRTLDVQDISPESVTLSPSIRMIIMRNIHTLSHGGMCSLMSSISNAHLLLHIDLNSVKCRDHITGEGCQYEIELSAHSGLSTLHVQDISPESVTLSPSITWIEMRNIHTLSHDSMCSLMSSLSNVHSLDYIDLDSVKCRDHVTGEGCQYEIDLSAHSALWMFCLRDISAESVTLSPSITSIDMRNIHTLSHGGMCSLMSSISNTHSFERIYLNSVKCRDHITGVGCQYELDLSGHSRLEILFVTDISLESVTLSPSIKVIALSDIHTLSHDSMCSLMSSISNVPQGGYRYLKSIRCIDVSGNQCGNEIE